MYFRRMDLPAGPVEVDWNEPKILIQAKSPVAELVDLAAEKRKRYAALEAISTLGEDYVVKNSGAHWTEDTSDPLNFDYNLKKVYHEAQVLCLKKHKDYGPKNISLSPGGPLNGLRVRLWDKMARINNLIDSGAEPANESLRDSFVDLLNYSAIALMCIDGNWPSE